MARTLKISNFFKRRSSAKFQKAEYLVAKYNPTMAGNKMQEGRYSIMIKTEDGNEQRIEFTFTEMEKLKSIINQL